jgi:hypothetical protein
MKDCVGGEMLNKILGSEIGLCESRGRLRGVEDVPEIAGEVLFAELLSSPIPPNPDPWAPCPTEVLLDGGGTGMLPIVVNPILSCINVGDIWNELDRNEMSPCGNAKSNNDPRDSGGLDCAWLLP